jgi:hypothetical protein
MRIAISLILTLIIYSFIVFFFLFFLFPQQKQEKKVYVHTAIIAPKAKINKRGDKNKKTKLNKKTVTKIKKKVKPVKKQGSKSNVTHGGKDIGFNDIFKSVKYNVETKKITPKAQLDMSRLKGIERNLKKIKKLSFQVNFVQQSGQKLSKKEIDDIISQKLYVIWDNISTMPSDYAKINIQNSNGKVNAVILDSNLDEQKQKELINRIERLNFDKNFNITVIFESKVDND